MSTSFLKRAAQHKSFVVGAALTGALILAALLSLVWTPWPATEIDVPNKLAPPSAAPFFMTNGSR